MESGSDPDCSGAGGEFRICALEESGIAFSESAETFGAGSGEYASANESGFDGSCARDESARHDRGDSDPVCAGRFDHSDCEPGDECGEPARDRHGDAAGSRCGGIRCC